jgi:hypothetical protein
MTLALISAVQAVAAQLPEGVAGGVVIVGATLTVGNVAVLVKAIMGMGQFQGELTAFREYVSRELGELRSDTRSLPCRNGRGCSE